MLVYLYCTSLIENENVFIIYVINEFARSMAGVDGGNGSFQSQTQSPSSSRATRASVVYSSVFLEALKRNGAQRGTSIIV